MDAKLRDLAPATVCLQRLMMEGLARLALQATDGPA